MDVRNLREIADKGPLECSCHGDPEACVCSAIIGLCDAYTALAARQEGVREAAQFLMDRLDEFNPGDEEAEREYHGHVAPALSRLRRCLEQGQ